MSGGRRGFNQIPLIPNVTFSAVQWTNPGLVGFLPCSSAALHASAPLRTVAAMALQGKLGHADSPVIKHWPQQHGLHISWPQTELVRVLGCFLSFFSTSIWEVSARLKHKRRCIILFFIKISFIIIARVWLKLAPPFTHSRHHKLYKIFLKNYFASFVDCWQQRAFR